MWVPHVRLSDIWFTNKRLSFLKKELGVLKREDVCEHLGHGGAMRTGGVGDEGHDCIKKLEDHGWGRHRLPPHRDRS